MVAKKTTAKPKPRTKKPAAKKPTEAEKLAVLFHDTYESLAPKYGYETRPDTKTFDPKTPNGKLMVAVAKEVLKQNKPKPAKKPKAPVVTEDMFKAWFYKQSLDKFLFLSQEWNEANLKIKIPKLEDYDQWLNYFKSLSPTVIQRLAKTGVDFLTTEAYAALSRWHDIIKSPGRIDKIHQAGLTKTVADKNKETILQLAQRGDRVGVLMAVRDRIAEKLEKGAGARDTASLSKEMTEVMTQIHELERRAGPKKETVLGGLMAETVDLRKRPGKNGGGTRNTSYKAKAATRVTIDDLED